MTTGQPEIMDRGVQTGPQWVVQAETNALVDKRLAWWFAPHAASTPNMQVFLKSGFIFDGNLTEFGVRNTGNLTAPSTNPRIDRVVIDASDGSISVVTGTQAPSPTAPAIPAGKIPIARVLLYVGMTVITNNDITDERVFSGGSSSQLDTVFNGTSAGTTHDFTCPYADPKGFTIGFFNVDFTADDYLFCQLGDSGGIETTGYISRLAQETGSGSGFALNDTTQQAVSCISTAGHQGNMQALLVDPSTNTWTFSGVSGVTGGIGYVHGSKQLSGTLTTVRIKGRAGNTFATGLININWFN